MLCDQYSVREVVRSLAESGPTHPDRAYAINPNPREGTGELDILLEDLTGLIRVIQARSDVPEALAKCRQKMRAAVEILLDPGVKLEAKLARACPFVSCPGTDRQGLVVAALGAQAMLEVFILLLPAIHDDEVQDPRFQYLRSPRALVGDLHMALHQPNPAQAVVDLVTCAAARLLRVGLNQSLSQCAQQHLGLFAELIHKLQQHTLCSYSLSTLEQLEYAIDDA